MSNVNDDLKLKGKLTIALNDEVVQEVDNLVVTAGKGYVASRIKDASATAMSHMAIVSGAVVTYVATFGAGTGTGAVTEAGILNASSSGTLLCRTEFNVVNKGSSDSMTVTWTVTVS